MIPLRFCGFVAVLALCLSARPAPTGEKKPSELITRDRIQLALAGAEMIVAEAKKKAGELKLKVNIAVVDDGGHLLSFARMDLPGSMAGPSRRRKAGWLTPLSWMQWRRRDSSSWAALSARMKRC